MGKLPLLRPLAAGTAVIAALALGPAAASATSPPLVGAATHPLWDDATATDTKAELDRLVEAGANVVRIDISWSTLEAQGKGLFSSAYVARADAFFAAAHERDLRVIATFWSTPCWASSAPDDLKDGCTEPWWERDVELYPPADAAELGRAAAWVAERWRDDLAAIEIWNEPNCTCFFTVPDQRHAAEYAELLQGSYGRIKAVAPEVAVIGPAMLMSSGEFLRNVYRNGGGAHMDGVSVRPFSRGRDPSDETLPEGGRMYSYVHGVPWLREVMAEYGQAHKPLWFTELGWSSCTGTNEWCVSEETQARYLGTALRIIRDRWDFVHAVAVYSLRNKGVEPTDRESQMGLLHRDFTPKPAFWAFRDALADLATNPFSKPVAQSPSEVPGQTNVAPPTVDGTEATLDLAAPVVGRLTLKPAVLRRRGARPLLRFVLSERAVTTVKFERLRAGRWVPLRGALRQADGPGRSGVRLSGRLRGRRLPPGRYRLSVVARDAAGNASEVRRVRLRIAG